jgi:hypothetical protein
MTDNDSTGSMPSEQEPAVAPQQEPDSGGAEDDPGYLTETGEAVGEDGSVVPIIGGLPAVEGSSWDIGASADDRGAGLAHELGGPSDQADREDANGS